MDTLGLWALITEKSPKENSSEDYERYKKFLYETNVLYGDYDPRSKKFSIQFGMIFREGIVSEDDNIKAPSEVMIFVL